MTKPSSKLRYRYRYWLPVITKTFVSYPALTDGGNNQLIIKIMVSCRATLCSSSPADSECSLHGFFMRKRVNVCFLSVLIIPEKLSYLQVRVAFNARQLTLLIINQLVGGNVI